MEVGSHWSGFDTCICKRLLGALSQGGCLELQEVVLGIYPNYLGEKNVSTQNSVHKRL